MNRREKLQLLIDEKFKGNAAAFARAIERSPAQVHHWLKGIRSIGDAGARHIELTLDLPQGWFNGKDVLVSNFEAAPDIQPAIPIISWIAAGSFTGMVEQILPSFEDRDSWVYTTRKHSPNSFGLTIRGESMFNPGGKVSFQEGEIILVDPEMNALNGDFVIARLDDESEATFKKLVIEGDTKYLVALNPDWPERIIKFNGNASIIGVVYEKVVRFK